MRATRRATSRSLSAPRSARLGAPVEMASLDHASAMYAAHLPPPSAAYGLAGADYVADLVVTSRSVETMTDRTFELRGRGARAHGAVSATSPGGAARPLALSTGLFGDPVTDIVALAADVQEGNLHLFRVESIYEVELHQTLASQALPGGLHPLSKGPVAALHYGALLAAGDLDRNGDAEAVVVAPAGGRAGRRRGGDLRLRQRHVPVRAPAPAAARVAARRRLEAHAARRRRRRPARRPPRRRLQRGAHRPRDPLELW